MRTSLRLAGTLALSLLGLGMAGTAHAQIVTFSGSDIGANNLSQMPNSVVAATSFTTAASALGTVQMINFESAPVGPFASLNVAPGVTLTGTSPSILNAPSGSPASVYGFNTTAGGANFLSLFGGTATFSFTGGVQAFGAYFTGLQLSGETITFSDGSSQTVNLPAGNSNSGTSAFVGFTDINKTIVGVTVTAGGDIIGVDDVRFVNSGAGPAAVPEPGEWAVMGMAALSVGGLMVRARRKRSA